MDNIDSTCKRFPELRKKCPSRCGEPGCKDKPECNNATLTSDVCKLVDCPIGCANV